VDEVKKVFQNEHTRENFEAAKGKTWGKVNELAAEVKSQGRKEAVSKFRLMSGHDCLAHHLHKSGIYQTSRCVLCNNPDDVTNSEYLLHCPTLNHEAQQTKDLVSFYWEAGETNDLIVSFCH
jgi:hypothetical protein